MGWVGLVSLLLGGPCLRRPSPLEALPPGDVSRTGCWINPAPWLQRPSPLEVLRTGYVVDPWSAGSGFLALRWEVGGR